MEPTYTPNIVSPSFIEKLLMIGASWCFDIEIRQGSKGRERLDDWQVRDNNC